MMKQLFKYKRLLLNNLIIFGVFLLLLGCAQETAPTGGPKDTQPPIALKSKPKTKQTHFVDKTISITFDEFVVLNDASNQVLISPPILPKPTFSTKGKSVIVNFKDSELQPNTTYNIFFGEAIQDLHEGNIIPDFHYVFSTGESVDSLSLSGSVTNAFENLPSEGVFVMLYQDDNDTIPFDSLPYRVLPEYICRTKKDGSFSFHNLSSGQYKIFSLKDENRNFLYDLPNETIGFYDAPVEPIFIQEADSSSNTDTLVNTYAIDLYQFTEVDSTVKLLEVKVIDSLQAQFFFSYETKNPQFRLLSPEVAMTDSSWMYQIWTPSNDTLSAWFPTLISDSLQIEISNNRQVIDTVLIALKQPAKKRERNKKEEQTLVQPDSIVLPPLKITTNGSGSFVFFGTLKFSFPTPLTQLDFSQIVFVAKEDTIKTPPIIYNENKREAVFDYVFAEQTRYSVMLPKGACKDIIGLTNDTLRCSFTTDESSKYGTLKLNLNLPDDAPQVIVQLLSEDGKKVVKERIVNQNSSIDFGYLAPQKVKVKAIFDANGNNRWNSGNYLHQIQPERVYLFDKVIDIRAYWDAEESWNLQE